MRLSCVVPGCRRTRGQRKGEKPIREDERWICGDHWKLVDRGLKALRTKTRRRWDKKVAIAQFAENAASATFQANYGKAGPGTFRPEDVDACSKAEESVLRAEWARWRTLQGMWKRMERQAIERAAGL